VTTEGDKLDPSVVEAQLAQYAKDLRELYRNNKQLDQKASEQDRLVRLRVQEISALNKFANGALMRQFEVEDAYESLLSRLDVLSDHILPIAERQTLKSWVAEGRAKLKKLREES
jgi:multidrug resistance efflux pump